MEWAKNTYPYYVATMCMSDKILCVCVKGVGGYLATSWELLVLAASRRASPGHHKDRNRYTNITTGQYR